MTSIMAPLCDTTIQLPVSIAPQYPPTVKATALRTQDELLRAGDDRVFNRAIKPNVPRDRTEVVQLIRVMFMRQGFIRTHR